jgi:hypothetical protein
MAFLKAYDVPLNFMMYITSAMKTLKIKGSQLRKMKLEIYFAKCSLKKTTLPFPKKKTVLIF